ncbi:putative transaldolase [Capsulimonas corticalis]|uniref:Transaldolase n=1 Tax=Capsulimonas corticalis TaxID=2219043 RepID=A0A402D6Z6_9BACT|nr:transaldolase family protein [Capsulimonas corticalis]BDI29365.1 putative transaldolase [Capsulimonas corticalis]
MKFFIDTANIDEIKKAKQWGILDGVTTNPSLIAKEGITHKTRVQEILELVGDLPVSAECVESDYDKLIGEARDIASWAPNVYVKVPMTPTALEVVKELSPQGVNFNVTLVFSLPQALLAAKAGASFISFFVGRIDDMGSGEAAQNIADAVRMVKNYDFPKDPEILVASIRGPLQVTESIRSGAQIATIPYKIMEQLFHHPLTDIGVKNFYDDYVKATGKDVDLGAASL